MPRNRLHDLSAKQLRAIDLLMLGWAPRKVAAELGINPSTLWRWRTQNFAFEAELNRRRQELMSAVRGKALAMVAKAFDVLDEELEGPNRVKAVDTLLRVVGVDSVDISRWGPTDPEAIAEQRNREAEQRQREEQRRTMRHRREDYEQDLDELLLPKRIEG